MTPKQLGVPALLAVAMLLMSGCDQAEKSAQQLLGKATESAKQAIDDTHKAADQAISDATGGLISIKPPADDEEKDQDSSTQEI